MAKKIPMVTKRLWLKSYEKGITQEAIAKKNKRDVRTIKKAIEDARRDRDTHQVYAEMLKGALHGHQQDLMILLEQLKELLKPFSSFKKIPYKLSEFEYFNINGGKVRYETLPRMKVLDIKLDVQEQPLWPLLKEHLKQDPFKKSFDNWERILESLLDELMNLKQTMVKLLKEKTSYKVKDANTNGSFILDSGVDHLFDYYCTHALSLPGLREMLDNIHADPKTGQVKYGEGTTLAHCRGKEEQCKNNIITALEQLLITEETKAYFITRQSHKKSIEKVKRDVDEIIMTRLVPGQCRVCRRLGL